MRLYERRNYLLHTPKLIGDILIRGNYHFIWDQIPMSTAHMPLKKRLNLLKSGANLIYRRTHAWSWPLHLHVEPTNYCNLKCAVCPTGIGKLNRKPASMDPALLEHLIDEVGTYLMTLSLWGWGEPLLHPEIGEMLRILHNRGINTLLSTNGQNLNDDKVIRALLDYPPDYLLVCIDGLTDETNSQFRVGARLEPALAGVHELAEIKRKKGLKPPNLHFRYIVMKHNEHELPQIRDFAIKNKFDSLSIRTLSVIDAPDDTHHNLLPDDESLRAYGYNNDTRISRKDFFCEKAFTFPAMFADGTVVACDQDCNAQQPLGKLTTESSFADIWWSKQAAQIKKTIRNNAEEFSFCKNCPFRDRPVSTCSIRYIDLL